MLLEVNAAVQSARALLDVIKANKQLADVSELHTAVSKLNAELARAWEMTLASQEKQATLQEKQAALTERIRKLEKEIGELKDWDRETERYQLTEVATGVFAYCLKSGMENNEPTHYLCTNCFAKGEKSILQADTPGQPGRPVPLYCCPRCRTIIHVATRPRMVPLLRT